MAPRITTLAAFVRHIEGRRTSTKYTHFYRGHSASGHELRPSLFRRHNNRKHEKNILRELISMHPAEFNQDHGVFEQLVRMQHFSLPTRLLDVSLNPLVALYFCCASNPNETGEFIQISVESSKVKYYDSDTVSCVANLSNLSGKERDSLRRCVTDADLAVSDSGKRLLQFIKSEKPYFLPQIVRAHLDSPMAVRPRLTNRRLLAQQGAFLLFGLKTYIKDDNAVGLKVERMPVSSLLKKKARDSLDRIGVNTSTMFPEIESAARYIMSKITPISDEEIGE